MKKVFARWWLLIAFGALSSMAEDQPNIVVIVADDQGYADVSYSPHAASYVKTPHIDALAAQSTICSSGYTSGFVCSPTRAGLMTGRYQQRFGVYDAGEGGSGMPLEERWIPMFLKPAGYKSGAFGKWHLGLTPEYNAVNRGFDEFYGFMGRGAHPYFDHSDEKHPIFRGLEPLKNETGYLTTRITEEAVDFIDRNKADPFFLYVAYNAVHTPAEAPEEDIKPVTNDPVRNTLVAMLKHLDLGVGAIVDKLKEDQLFDNTLLFYISDNGGAGAMSADNTPLRGFKQHDYEGGIRVPFIVSWPKQIEQGQTVDTVLWSTDILPTILAAAKIATPTNRPLDGKNLLPVLKGETDHLHDQLYWASGARRGQWAIRSGAWKLVGVKDKVELYNIEADISEEKDLADQYPEKVAKLTADHRKWLAEMAEPQSGQPKIWTPEFESKAKKKKNKKKDKKTN